MEVVCGLQDSPANYRLSSSLRCHQPFVPKLSDACEWNYGDMVAQILSVLGVSAVFHLLWLVMNQAWRCLEVCLGSRPPRLHVFPSPLCRLNLLTQWNS